jgi:hypothetical protein
MPTQTVYRLTKKKKNSGYGAVIARSVIEFSVANEPATIDAIHITNSAIPIIQQFLASFGSSCRTTK